MISLNENTPGGTHLSRFPRYRYKLNTFSKFYSHCFQLKLGGKRAARSQGRAITSTEGVRHIYFSITYIL